MPTLSRSKALRGEMSPQELAKYKALLSSTAIVLVETAKLKPYPKNAKDHPEAQIGLLAEAIRKFGFVHPITIDASNEIIAGHGRLEAAKRLGLTQVPAIVLTHLNEGQKRALRIADNKLAELSSWNVPNLKIELTDLTSPELDIDPMILGFDTVDVDRIIDGEEQTPKSDPADDLPVVAADQEAVTRRGDLWICGEHMLLCGNALSGADYETLLRDQRARVVFTDPPYNVPNNGHVTQRSEVREFAMARGEMTSDEFANFLGTTTGHIADHVQDGAVMYVCMDWRHLSELATGTRHSFGPPKNLIVWVKSNAGMGSFYRSQHEMIMVYVAGTAAAVNNFRLGARGRYRTNVWHYPGMNSFAKDRDATLAMHPTVKPVALVADALRDCSNRGDVVLDPFAGSGTTMIAAERTGRRARLLEIDPLYCDVIIERWQKFTGCEARLAQSDATLEQTRSARGSGEEEVTRS